VAAEIDSADSARTRLAELGVWREMKTGRIDMPDIYRLGFKLARRGGVRGGLYNAGQHRP